MKDRTMDDVQNCDSYVNIPLSQTIDNINLLVSQRRRNVFPVELSYKQKTGRWIMPRIVIVILIYYCHKPIDNINLLVS
jgi:hypothetical protein